MPLPFRFRHRYGYNVAWLFRKNGFFVRIFKLRVHVWIDGAYSRKG